MLSDNAQMPPWEPRDNLPDLSRTLICYRGLEALWNDVRSLPTTTVPYSTLPRYRALEDQVAETRAPYRTVPYRSAQSVTDDERKADTR